MNKEKWFAAAKEAGFENFEIFQELNEERTFTWFEGELDTYVTSHVLGTAFRGMYEGKMVNASSEDTSDDQMDDVLSSMKTQAAMITSEDAEMPRGKEEINALEKKEFVHFDANDIKALLKKTEEKIFAFDKRIFQVNHLTFQESTSKRTIANTLGVDLEEESGVHVLVAGAAAKEGDEIRTGFEMEKADDLSALDLDEFIKRLGEDVLSQLNASIPSSGTYPVIIEKGALTQLFAAFADMFSGEQIHKGISPLRDSLNKQVFSDKITIVDDPACEDAALRCAFDDEGCPTRRKTLVENGVFKEMLHSTKSALAMNTESSGNGFRASYDSPIGVRPRNCMIVPGEKDLDGLMAEMKEGILITDFAGLHAGLNHVTGDFSLQSSGYLIKDGKKAGGLTLMTAAGNFLDLLSNVREVGSDLKWGIRSIVTPSILFDSVSISGK